MQVILMYESIQDWDKILVRSPTRYLFIQLHVFLTYEVYLPVEFNIFFMYEVPLHKSNKD